MALNTGRHRVENHPGPHPLAIPQLHGLLPRLRDLPIDPGGAV